MCNRAQACKDREKVGTMVPVAYGSIPRVKQNLMSKTSSVLLVRKYFGFSANTCTKEIYVPRQY